MAHPWPGNIRELQNVLERAVVLAEEGIVSIPELLPATDPPALGSEGGSLDPAGCDPCSPSSEGLDAVSRAHILHVLKQTNWIVAGPHGAAARLEMKRSTLNFRMKKLGIVRPGRAPST